MGYLLAGKLTTACGMTKLEARQAWIRHIIKARCDGSVATFAREIGKSDSYVYRMLYPEGKDGAKGIGEETVKVIMDAFPDDIPPASADVLPASLGGPAEAAPIRMFTKERRASDDVLAVQIALESLLLAVLQRTPGAAAAFLADAKEVADGHHFSTRSGFLGQLFDIAREVRSEEEAAARARRRAGSVARTKREKPDQAS